MIRGPCGVFNNNSPCMIHGKCSELYPRDLIAHTMTGNDGYPLYRRRSVADNERSVVVKVKKGHANVFASYTLSQIYTLHPNKNECYIGLLLVNIQTLFQQLRTISGHLYATYCETSQLLLNYDSDWDNTLKNSVISSSPHQIRTLFAMIISSCFPLNPKDLWVKYRDV